MAVVLIESVRSWIRLFKSTPPDYRSREEIEEETKKENERLEALGVPTAAVIRLTPEERAIREEERMVKAALD